MESENIDEVLQEGGTTRVTLNGSTDRVQIDIPGTTPVFLTLAQVANLAFRTRNILRSFSFPSDPETTYTDRPLLLSDLVSLMVDNRPSNIEPRTDIETIFNNIPLAQYKHLPDPRYLSEFPRTEGGNIEESTLETQEVSLPSEPNEEVLPSLDIVEPSSTGGSYKRSSHKKRKSTRIRTKKNKKL